MPQFVLNVATGEQTIIETPAPTLAERKVAMKEALKQEQINRFLAGFTYDFGGQIGVHTFDMRPDKDDKANWHLGMTECAANVQGGNGAGAFNMRSAANVTVQTTYAGGLACLQAMLAWGKVMLSNKWSIEDAINVAEDHAALDLIDVTVGWP